VECCWRGSTPAAEGFAQNLLRLHYGRASAREFFVHELFVWVPFSARSFDTLSLARARLRIRLFESKSVSTDREATSASDSLN
jgi:hypothetical protein